MLTGDCREEAMLLVVGEGNSGKSKFIDCLGDMLGDYCVTAKIEMLMESKIERHSSEMAEIAGARMIRASEPEEGSRWNEALLKLITGRDTISARRLYQSPFTFRPQGKLIIGANFRPSLKSTGEEIRRRMHLVNFPGAVPVEDRIYDLPEKLRAEWPAILQWAIDGCLAWQDYGLGKPEAVEEATKDYLDDEDTLAAWIHESCDLGGECRASDAYKSYRHFVQERGEMPVSQKRFSARLESRGFGKRKSGSMIIVGLSLKPGPAPAGQYYND
jgi:putative DNA primase/helicase